MHHTARYICVCQSRYAELSTDQTCGKCVSCVVCVVYPLPVCAVCGAFSSSSPFPYLLLCGFPTLTPPSSLHLHTARDSRVPALIALSLNSTGVLPLTRFHNGTRVSSIGTMGTKAWSFFSQDQVYSPDS